jgi:hypothetical protein
LARALASSPQVTAAARDQRRPFVDETIVDVTRFVVSCVDLGGTRIEGIAIGSGTSSTGRNQFPMRKAHFPIVSLSPKERAAQELLPQTRSAAHDALREHGCVLLRGCFEVTFIKQLAKAWHKNNPQDAATMTKGAYTGNMGSEMPLRPMTISQRSPNRFEITLKMTGPFSNPALFANTIVLSILKMSLK